MKHQCTQAYLKKNLKLSKSGNPYIQTKKGKVNCKAKLVCFIRLEVPKSKAKWISTKKIKQKR